MVTVSWVGIKGEHLRFLHASIAANKAIGLLNIRRRLANEL